MMIIPPIEQYTNNYLIVEAFPLFESNYVTVYVSTESFQIEHIIISGQFYIVTNWQNVTCLSGEVCGHISIE